MSIIRFCKSEKKKYINYIKNAKINRVYTLTLQKTYDAVYNVLTQTLIFPEVINELINEYMTDVMAFDIKHEGSYSGIFISIATKNVCINFIKYDFKLRQYVTPNDSENTSIRNSSLWPSNHNDTKIKSICTFTRTSDYVDNEELSDVTSRINFIPLFNYYMKNMYSKNEYMRKFRLCGYWNNYKYVRHDIIVCEYPNEDLLPIKVRLVIKNHKMFKNMIVMLKIITNAVYDSIGKN